mgnify:CR=1 FL=1
MKFRVLSLIAVLVGAISSCEVIKLNQQDDEDTMDQVVIPSTPPESSEQLEILLHGGDERAWATISFTFLGVGGIQDCRLDDSMMVNNDGTYEYNGGENLCGAEDSERIRTGTWEVINDGNNIVFDRGTVNEYMADITGISDDMIAISGEYLGLDLTGIYQIN